ncbi:MAG: hypothetical protein KC620_21910, partial [Myxococcales bacterium]|nr:hypothetical protein [Myxococcales bacterium]
MNIVDFHVHASDFTKLRRDIQDFITHRPMEEGIDLPTMLWRPAEVRAYLQKNGVQHAVVLAECGPGTNYTNDSRAITWFAGDDGFFIPFGNINPECHDVAQELAL